jgi:hypothetical protein
MKTISQAEKNDILLALALAFEKNFARSRETVLTVREQAENSFGALNGEDLELLKARAELLDGTSSGNREAWHEKQLDRIRGRGKTKRLDENINPSHIVEALGR